MAATTTESQPRVLGTNDSGKNRHVRRVLDIEHREHPFPFTELEFDIEGTVTQGKINAIPLIKQGAFVGLMIVDGRKIDERQTSLATAVGEGPFGFFNRADIKHTSVARHAPEVFVISATQQTIIEEKVGSKPGFLTLAGVTAATTYITNRTNAYEVVGLNDRGQTRDAVVSGLITEEINQIFDPTTGRVNPSKLRDLVHVLNAEGVLPQPTSSIDLENGGYNARLLLPQLAALVAAVSEDDGAAAEIVKKAFDIVNRNRSSLVERIVRTGYNKTDLYTYAIRPRGLSLVYTRYDEAILPEETALAENGQATQAQASEETIPTTSTTDQEVTTPTASHPSTETQVNEPVKRKPGFMRVNAIVTAENVTLSAVNAQREQLIFKYHRDGEIYIEDPTTNHERILEVEDGALLNFACDLFIDFHMKVLGAITHDLYFNNSVLITGQEESLGFASGLAQYAHAVDKLPGENAYRTPKAHVQGRHRRGLQEKGETIPYNTIGRWLGFAQESRLLPNTGSLVLDQISSNFRNNSILLRPTDENIQSRDVKVQIQQAEDGGLQIKVTGLALAKRRNRATTEDEMEQLTETYSVPPADQLEYRLTTYVEGEGVIRTNDARKTPYTLETARKLLRLLGNDASISSLLASTKGTGISIARETTSAIMEAWNPSTTLSREDQETLRLPRSTTRPAASNISEILFSTEIETLADGRGDPADTKPIDEDWLLDR